MSLVVRSFVPDDADAWDNFCDKSHQSTFLHLRKFISYHGDRFIDCSVIIEECGQWVGVLPAAVSVMGSSQVVSHPGLSYGGILHQGRLKGERMVAALGRIREHYRDLGFSILIYKAIPSIYHVVPAQDDVYALHRVGARLSRCDLTSTIDLTRRLPLAERRRRSLKKARASGMDVVEGSQYLPPLWAVLTDNLMRRHGVRPVHSLDEIALLADRFPMNIRCFAGLAGNEVVAGVVVFSTATVDHAQYIASTESGLRISALDLVFERCIVEAGRNGKRWFDFGISTEREGTVLNEGLYQFKSEFGGGGFVHQFFELDLWGNDDVYQ